MIIIRLFSPPPPYATDRGDGHLSGGVHVLVVSADAEDTKVRSVGRTRKRHQGRRRRRRDSVCGRSGVATPSRDMVGRGEFLDVWNFIFEIFKQLNEI